MHQSQYRRVVPCWGSAWLLDCQGEKYHPSKTGHISLTSRPTPVVVALLAAAALLAACSDLTVPGTSLSTSDLIILRQQAGAPSPGSATFYVSNARQVARSLRHSDGSLTLFAELQFPAGSLASLDGAPLGSNDSVRVTVDAEPGIYGLRISPPGLRFSVSARPSLRFSYARYGDLSVAAGSSRYPNPDAYAGALEIWREVGLERWSSAGGAGNPGTDIRSSIAESGHYVVAAPR